MSTRPILPPTAWYIPHQAAVYLLEWREEADGTYALISYVEWTGS